MANMVMKIYYYSSNTLYHTISYLLLYQNLFIYFMIIPWTVKINFHIKIEKFVNLYYIDPILLSHNLFIFNECFKHSKRNSNSTIFFKKN